MDVNLITASLLEAASTDSTFLSALAVRFSALATVQEGIDLGDLPTESDCPLVAISFMGKKGGVREDVEEIVYAISLVVADNSDPERVGGMALIKRYPQLAKLETCRQALVNSFSGADLNGGYIAGVEVENDPLEDFPYFSTNMVLTISRPYGVRENRLI